MKNVLISLLALAAISGSALADAGTSHDDRGLSLQKPVYGAANNSTATKAFAIPADSTKLTAFERMNLKAGERRNDEGRQSRGPAKESMM